jgi:hypothetical protein
MNTPQSLPEKITVVLTQDHFLRSDGYLSCSNCALGVALKDHFIAPLQISIGGTFVRIEHNNAEDKDTIYNICDGVIGFDNNLIIDAYDVIDEGGEIEPITVELFKRS